MQRGCVEAFLVSEALAGGSYIKQGLVVSIEEWSSSVKEYWREIRNLDTPSRQRHTGTGGQANGDRQENQDITTTTTANRTQSVHSSRDLVSSFPPSLSPCNPLDEHKKQWRSSKGWLSSYISGLSTSPEVSTCCRTTEREQHWPQEPVTSNTATQNSRVLLCLTL